MTWRAISARPGEEVRLFYVGLTRAKRQIFLCRARQRTKFGRTEMAEPSPFLEVISRALSGEAAGGGGGVRGAGGTNNVANRLANQKNFAAGAGAGGGRWAGAGGRGRGRGRGRGVQGSGGRGVHTDAAADAGTTYILSATSSKRIFNPRFLS